MGIQQNVNSQAKAQSDAFLSHARMLTIKADMVEIQRLGILTTQITQEQLDDVDAWILELRALIKYD